MSQIHVLWRKYPGDDAWLHIVKKWRRENNWDQLSNRAALVSIAGGDEGLAIALAAEVAEVPEDVARWLVEPLPALDHRSVEDVLRNEPHGMKIIRAMLIAMRNDPFLH